jgi:hypothetical protein
MSLKLDGKDLPFPIVSFKPFLHGSKEQRYAVGKELYNAFHQYGWVYLKDFGISEDEIDAMFANVSPYNKSALGQVECTINSTLRVENISRDQCRRNSR